MRLGPVPFRSRCTRQPSLRAQRAIGSADAETRDEGRCRGPRLRRAFRGQSPMALIAPGVRRRRTPEKVWPWLVQMGQGRGGLYTYEWIENLLGAKIHNPHGRKPVRTPARARWGTGRQRRRDRPPARPRSPRGGRAVDNAGRQDLELEPPERAPVRRRLPALRPRDLRPPSAPDRRLPSSPSWRLTKRCAADPPRPRTTGRRPCLTPGAAAPGTRTARRGAACDAPRAAPCHCRRR
jgi:hypothetical protein